MREKERMRDIRIEVEEMESWPIRARETKRRKTILTVVNIPLLNFIHSKTKYSNNKLQSMKNNSKSLGQMVFSQRPVWLVPCQH